MSFGSPELKPQQDREEPARGSYLESGRFSPGLLRALEVISDEWSANGLSVAEQASKLGRAFASLVRIPAARVPLEPRDFQFDIGRPPKDEYDILASYFGMKLVRPNQRLLKADQTG